MTSTQGHRLPSVAKARINPGPSGRGVSLRRPPSPCAPPPPRPPPPPHVPHSTPTYRFAQLQIRGQEGGAGSMPGPQPSRAKRKDSGSGQTQSGGPRAPHPRGCGCCGLWVWIGWDGGAGCVHGSGNLRAGVGRGAGPAGQSRWTGRLFICLSVIHPSSSLSPSG